MAPGEGDSEGDGKERMTSVPRGFVRRRVGGSRVVIRADLQEVAESELWRRGDGLAEAAGRGAGVTTFEVAGSRGPVQVVARDFRRGGVLGGLLGDRYLDADRAASELAVLEELRQRGLPVVEPVAALSARRWLSHRLRLLTVRFDRAVPLPVFVDREPDLRRATLDEAGRVVAQAFGLGLLHRDLHADNLIARTVESGGARDVEVRLLDLDRAKICSPLTETDRDGMLLRMARYLKRHATRLPVARTDTVRFLAGFGLSRAERRVEIERLAPEFERMLARHGIRAEENA